MRGAGLRHRCPTPCQAKPKVYAVYAFLTRFSAAMRSWGPNRTRHPGPHCAHFNCMCGGITNNKLVWSGLVWAGLGFCPNAGAL
jgi:hypothetical protein